MRISDWSSDVCSSDLHVPGHHRSRSRDLVDEARYLRARDRVGKTITEVWKDMPGEYPLDLTDRPPIRFGGFIVGPHSANRQRGGIALLWLRQRGDRIGPVLEIR